MTDDDSDYRPTDYLANCGLSYGYGSNEDSAVLNALRYAGPFDGGIDAPVTVAVWELYADSWQSHGPTGPERSAEWLSYTEYEIPRELAREVFENATEAYSALSTAFHEAEIAREEEPTNDS